MNVTPAREIAPGVYWLALGRGLLASSVYLVRSGSSWSLIDAGWSKDAATIRQVAASLFGADTPPASILLTHDHPDHAGAARQLAELWKRPVWVHPDELAIAQGSAAAIHDYAGPLDRWLILPSLSLTGRRRLAAMLLKSSLLGVAQAFELGTSPPGLAAWEVFHTPGHTPGHVAFFRRADRVAITGDALVSVDLNSWRGIVRHERTVAGPPWITTWSWPSAMASAAALAALEFTVLAGGHGMPLVGAQAREQASRFLRRIQR